ncbi:MAG: ABC transporter family protein [Candidatus Kaiserbacteria bacterium GW2011_GWA2_49_56]|uniref:ABC transporter family protein n=1 Tax=Candidatus Kaiserbacteria bacterium GW2011_GWA2_49_56 TaxID=1618670 RepID=A0A0G1VPM2_9BACT|nr:MAG: ABC transporter family protein [Candidatus Kaiserbacteria bacterium GW2011_GWA2_49_56]
MDAVVFQLYPVLLLAVGIVYVLFSRNPILGAGLLIWLIVFTTLQLILIRTIHPYRLKAAGEDSKMTGVLSDSLSNQATVTLFSGVPYERQRFAGAVERLKTAQYRAWKYDDNIWAVQGFLIVFVNAALLFIALALWKRGLLTVGDFILIQAYLLTLFERLVQAGREMRHVFNAVAEATEMAEVLRIPHEVRDAPGALPLVVGKGEIRFRDVTFNYQEGNVALQKFNLHITGGERVAFVGPSGAGKTTVTKLLLRFYDVNDGNIEIDGYDIANVTLESLREAIAFVPQDPVLFHRSLLENIRYGRRDATENEVIEAAKKAHCHEFITTLPKGYGTFVGERGVKLSGGERQRIAIARAILKNAPILVLDEATSSLDSESEALIQDALETLMKGKTVIVIAHRLSTVMKMDRIIVLEDGRITADGRHEELITQDGRYRTLWNIQAGGFLTDN